MVRHFELRQYSTDIVVSICFVFFTQYFTSDWPRLSKTIHVKSILQNHVLRKGLRQKKI